MKSEITWNKIENGSGPEETGMYLVSGKEIVNGEIKQVTKYIERDGYFGLYTGSRVFWHRETTKHMVLEYWAEIPKVTIEIK